MSFHWWSSASLKVAFPVQMKIDNKHFHWAKKLLSGIHWRSISSQLFSLAGPVLCYKPFCWWICIKQALSLDNLVEYIYMIIKVAWICRNETCRRDV